MVTFTSVDVFTLCFSENLPAAGNLAFNSAGTDIEWNDQGFSPSDSEGSSNNGVQWLGYDDQKLY